MNNNVLKNSLHGVFLKTCTAGLTVLEVLLAIVILTIITVILGQFVLAGDRLFGRNILIENATQLARNEAELIKAQAPTLEKIEDKEYERSVGGRTFLVKRTVLEKESLDTLVNEYSIRRIKLDVLNVIEGVSSESPVISFTFIQGYDVK